MQNNLEGQHALSAVYPQNSVCKQRVQDKRAEMPAPVSATAVLYNLIPFFWTICTLESLMMISAHRGKTATLTSCSQRHCGFSFYDFRAEQAD